MDHPPLPEHPAGHKKHSKNISYSRTTLTRRSTKGPLDAPPDLQPVVVDDPLKAAPRKSLEAQRPTTGSSKRSSRYISPARPSGEATQTKDLSFLFEPSIYHTLPPLLTLDDEAPAPKDLKSSLLPHALSTLDYRHAADICASRLSLPPAPEPPEVFSLLYTRLASLVILNYTALAATESKILDDIIHDNVLTETSGGATIGSVIPWNLQVLWARLTGIAHKEVRQSITAYYDLAARARRAYRICLETEKSSSSATSEDALVWRRRLKELGLSVANILVESGNLEGAARHLQSLQVTSDSGADTDLQGGANDHMDAIFRTRTALVYMTIGDVDAANRCLSASPPPGPGEVVASAAPISALLPPLLAIVEGNYEDAATQLRALLSDQTLTPTEQTLVKNNLAVTLFYTGHATETVALLEELVGLGREPDNGNVDEPEDLGSHALTFTLATCYEIMGENAERRKVELARHVVRQGSGGVENGAGDFKLYD